MKPKSGNLSASSLAVWELCQKRYVAEQVERVPSPGDNEPANTGSAVHFALQHFINAVFLHKSHQWEDVDYLIRLYDQGYEQSFGTFNKKDKPYKDGLALVKKWHGYTDLSNSDPEAPKVTVLSTEIKELFPIDDGMRLTAIVDRCDWLEYPNGKRAIRVVDYKTKQLRASHQDLKDNFQLKIYALAMAMKYKGYQFDEIIVGLDQIRHDGFIGVSFHQADWVDAWEYLRKTSAYIQSLDVDDAKYKLNSECRFCPIKTDCPELRRNVAAGGIMSLSVDDAVRMHTELAAQIKGNQAILEQIDEMILTEAKNNDKLAWEADDLKVNITSKGYRAVTDVERAAKIIGPDLMARVAKLNVTEVDKMIQGGMLDEKQIAQLTALIGKNYGKASVNIKPKPII